MRIMRYRGCEIEEGMSSKLFAQDLHCDRELGRCCRRKGQACNECTIILRRHDQQSCSIYQAFLKLVCKDETISLID